MKMLGCLKNIQLLSNHREERSCTFIIDNTIFKKNPLISATLIPFLYKGYSALDLNKDSCMEISSSFFVPWLGYIFAHIIQNISGGNIIVVISLLTLRVGKHH